MRILKSALFWRILLSSLLVVAVLGWGLSRATAAHAELEKQFVRLVQHDLKLADEAEQLLRLMVDLETGKRGYLLTGDRTFLAPYEQARQELEGLLSEAQDVAEDGMEDERVAAFSHGGFIGEALALASGSRSFAFNGAANASISRLVITDDRWIVRGYNDTAHLDGLG